MYLAVTIQCRKKFRKNNKPIFKNPCDYTNKYGYSYYEGINYTKSLARIHFLISLHLCLYSKLKLNFTFTKNKSLYSTDI